jgi:hypothetical protein
MVRDENHHDYKHRRLLPEKCTQTIENTKNMVDEVGKAIVMVNTIR